MQTVMPGSARRPHHSPRSLGAARSAGLQLPSLPRFHPANFPSQGSSYASTPASGVTSPQPPVSPRSQQRQYSDAQRQLYAYQREVLASVGRSYSGASASASSSSSSSARPSSPRLIPAGSPGPVTPLELENEAAGGYLVAGASSRAAGEHAQRELVDKLLREEAARRGEKPPKRKLVVGSY